MIKNRKHGHIGLGSAKLDEDVKWYIDVLGFELIGDFVHPNGNPIKFIKNKDIVLEMFPADENTAHGKFDHYAFDSQDIEADYKYCVEQGYQISTDGIEEIPTVWEKGVRYFKIVSPSGEQLEFCQVL